MRIYLPHDSDLRSIENALRLAREQYQKDAALGGPLAATFARYADDAHRIEACIRESTEHEDEQREIRVVSRRRWKQERRYSQAYVAGGWPAVERTPGAVRLPNRFEDEK
jgi:hypothetical protein